MTNLHLLIVNVVGRKMLSLSNSQLIIILLVDLFLFAMLILNGNSWLKSFRAIIVIIKLLKSHEMSGHSNVAHEQ